MKRSVYAVLLFTAVFCLFIPFTLVAQTSLTLTTANPAAPQETSYVYLPVITNRHDSQFPAPLFGVQMYGNSGVSSPYHPYLIGSQSRWLRNRISWESVEPTNRPVEEFIWGGADNATAAARPDSGGLHLVFVIGDGVPEWARLLPNKPYGPIHPNALPDFAEFVQAIVERYDGDGYQDAPGGQVIKHWELVNEPDSNREGWGEYGSEYAAMLQAAYTAIKLADPQAQVVMGGVAHDWFEYQGGPFNSSFLDDVLAAGGGNYFDVMNFHVYPLFAPNWDSNGTGLKEKTAVIRSKLASYGLNKPVIITEGGWYDSEPSSPDEQIARLVQLFTQSYAVNIKVMIWWMLHDPGSYFPNFGLVTNADNGPAPKAAYTAYQSAYNLLSNTRFVRELPPAETGAANMEAYLFQSLTGPLYVAWLNPYPTLETKPLRIPGSQATLLDGQGSYSNTIYDTDGDGYVIIPITRHPIYIRVN